jgi:hypothetical protein
MSLTELLTAFRPIIMWPLLDGVPTILECIDAIGVTASGRSI